MYMALSEQELIRREKLGKLRALGINPYPAAEYKVTHKTSEVKKQFEEGKAVVMAGRLMSRRIQGKASFAELQDSEGRFQLYFNRDEICLSEDATLYNEVYKKLLDIGDLIGVEGTLFKTQVGEMTLLVKNFTVLSKSLRPLPFPKEDAEGNIYDGFTDPELRYRQRYVDLVVNPQVKETFIKRTKITNTIRSFFNPTVSRSSAICSITHSSDAPLLWTQYAQTLRLWLSCMTSTVIDRLPLPSSISSSSCSSSPAAPVSSSPSSALDRLASGFLSDMTQ